MAVYKVHKTRDYTVMSNYHLRDKNMSLKAKGMLSVMLSLPDEWDYSINGLVAISKENVTAIKNALDELKDNGYLIVTKKMPNETATGRIEYEYDIYETPQEAQKQTLEKQGIENLHLENLSVENPLQLNTNQSFTKEVITNNKKENKPYKLIIEHLNKCANTNFRATTKTTQEHINARFAEGFTLEDFYTVIDKKCADWLGDEKMEQYLRPATLFGTKFEQYLNAPVAKKKTYGKTGIQIKPNTDDDLDGIL